LLTHKSSPEVERQKEDRMKKFLEIICRLLLSVFSMVGFAIMWLFAMWFRVPMHCMQFMTCQQQQELGTILVIVGLMMVVIGGIVVFIKSKKILTLAGIFTHQS